MLKKMEVKTKKNYLSPQIEIILLDNEISLSLDSLNVTPPDGPDEGYLSPEFIKNDPFRNNNA